jgi:hypothetical protein
VTYVEDELQKRLCLAIRQIYSQFEFYECIWYHDLADFPSDKKSLGRCLGVADNYTSSMAFRILKANGQVLVRKPVWSLKAAELDDIKVQAEIAILDEGMF